jgi:hypothetical protein
MEDPCQMRMFKNNILFVLCPIAVISPENHSQVSLYMVINAIRYCCVSLPRVIKQSFLYLLFLIVSQLITPLRCDITPYVMRKKRADLDSW